MSWFSYLQVYGNPENKIWPYILAQEAQKPVNLIFDFQGSQKMQVRVAISQKGLVKSILKLMVFSCPNHKTYHGVIGFHGHHI